MQVAFSNQLSGGVSKRFETLFLLEVFSSFHTIFKIPEGFKEFRPTADEEAVEGGHRKGTEFDSFKMPQTEKEEGHGHGQQQTAAIVSGFEFVDIDAE